MCGRISLDLDKRFSIDTDRHAWMVRLAIPGLSDLGRYGEALSEIDAFAPIRAEVIGERHPHTLSTRSLRIGIEIAGNRNVDQLPALREIIRNLVSAQGRHSEPALRARYRLARALWVRGEADAARREIAEIIGSFDPATSPEHEVLRAAIALRDLTEGHPSDEPLIL